MGGEGADGPMWWRVSTCGRRRDVTRDEDASAANPFHARSVPMRRLLDAILIVAAAVVVYSILFP
jgi:hypothetical protein